MDAQKLKDLSVATKGDVYDADYEGGTWMFKMVETHETLDNFVEATARYNSCTEEKTGTLGGLPFVAYNEVQIRKGDTRRSLSVIDFGDVRAVIDADLTDYL